MIYDHTIDGHPVKRLRCDVPACCEHDDVPAEWIDRWLETSAWRQSNGKHRCERCGGERAQ